MTRWKTLIMGALLLAALAAKPAQAVVVDLTMIDTKGNPLPGYTFVFNWPNGKTSSLTTDAVGRLHGDVPKGEHYCSFWSEDIHLASGRCNLTDLPGSKGVGGKKSAQTAKAKTPAKQATPEQASSIAPQPTSSELAGRSVELRADAMTYKERRDKALNDLGRSKMGKGPAGSYMILLSERALGSKEFGVVVSQLFDLDGSGDSSSAGDGGGGAD